MKTKLPPILPSVMPSVKFMLIAAILIASVPVASMMRPTIFAPYVTEKINLADVVPMTIGEWQMYPGFAEGQIVEPIGERANQFSIYDQKLKRVYTNGLGDVIMLVIAYGHNQSDAVQLHRPEICYAAGGFEILVEENTAIPLPFSPGNNFAATYLETRRITRFEPVTYWTRIGPDIPSSVITLQLSKLWTGLKGRVPDGIIIRVSSLSDRQLDARVQHRDFIQKLLSVVPDDGLPLFLGKLSKFRKNAS